MYQLFVTLRGGKVPAWVDGVTDLETRHLFSELRTP